MAVKENSHTSSVARSYCLRGQNTGYKVYVGQQAGGLSLCLINCIIVSEKAMAPPTWVSGANSPYSIGYATESYNGKWSLVIF